MSLLTVLRSPSCENASVSTDSEVEEEDEDEEDGSSRSRTSSFEGFFASKSAAFSIPDGDFARKASKHGGEMQMHLQSMVNLLRDDDVIRLVVKLETKYQLPGKVRYLAVVSSFSLEDVEESVVLGLDWVDNSVSIGLVLPLWRDTAIELDGDGGFELSTNYRLHILKPVSVQTMWTAFQWIHKCSDNARRNNQFPGSLSHGWTKYYDSLISSDQLCIKEWHETEENLKVEVHFIGTSKDDELLMKLIRHKLREVMMKVDLEEVTSRQVRESLEEEMQMDLRQHKQFIDKEMLTIFGQMDSASQIYDHVYLGSEWNASNLEELKENGVGYILNITKEIDNFFTGTFTYYNIRLWDEEESNLLPYWDDTFKFINQARDNGSKVLVHCKMGISRSASTVIAYGMKEYGTSLNDTMKQVKSRRQCVQPNQGFWKQLITYEGILNSSRHRYNELFNRRRTSSDKTDAGKVVKRRRHRRGRQKASTLTTSKIIEHVIVEEPKPNTIERNLFLDDIGQYSDGEEGTELGDDEDDDDVVGDDDIDDDDDEPLMMRPVDKGSAQEDALQTWEDETMGSAKSSPIQSPRSSPEPSDDENKIVETEGTENPVKKKPLHRALSSPSLRKVPKQRKVHKKTLDAGELDRCHSLRELLTGRVAAVKEDLKANTLGRTSGIKSEKSHSPERGEAIVPPRKGSSEDSDQGDSDHMGSESQMRAEESPEAKEEGISDDCIVKDAETEMAEAEDIGSTADQHQVLDAHGLRAVKTGTVKRQSRNFEEGKVNLPWELEELLRGQEAEMEKPCSPEPQEASTEVIPATADEPASGVVKKHTNALERKHSKNQETQETKTKVSESEEEISVFESVGTETSAPRKLIIPESSFAVEAVGKTAEVEQGLLGIFDTGIVRRQINEQMKNEKIQRRISTGHKVVRDNVEEPSESNKTAEESKTQVEKEEGETTSEGSGGEELPRGIVRRHTKDFEELHRLKSESLRSPVSDGEPDVFFKGKPMSPSQQKVEPTADVMVSPKKVIPLKEGPKDQEVEMSASAFDVDMMLERVNEDMKKEKSQRRSDSKDAEEFSTLALIEDVPVGGGDRTGDEDNSEIPRPGIVKRNTELLMGKARIVPEPDEKACDSKNTSTVKEDLDYNDVKTEPTSSRPAESLVSADSCSAQVENVVVKLRDKSDDVDKQVGLVKRQTLILEGKYQEELPRDESIKAAENIPDTADRESQPSTVTQAVYSGTESGRPFDVEVISLEDSADDNEGEQSPSGTVKRHTRLFEERGSGKEASTQGDIKTEVLLWDTKDFTVEKERQIENQSAVKSRGGGEEEPQESSVDTSSVVSVRFHLKLLEEIISSSTKREQHKQRTTKALAAIEEKRSQIDIARHKEDSRIELESDVNKESDIPEDYVFVPDSSSDEEPEHDNMLDSLSHSAVSLAIENAQKDLDDSDESTPESSGNVKRRTLLLEEQMREKGTSVRRHESMPKSIRPVERPGPFRKRSFSDTCGTDQPLGPLEPLNLSQELPSTSVPSPSKDKNGKCVRTSEETDSSSNITLHFNVKENSDEDNKLIETQDNEYQRPSVKETIQLLDGVQ